MNDSIKKSLILKENCVNICPHISRFFFGERVVLMSNRDKLIDTAAQLFHSHGFERTSIDLIMRESGVCRSNFYYYFKSKEALGLLATEKIASEFKEKFLSKTILNSALNPLERLDSFYEGAISYNRFLLSQDYYPGCFFGNLALEQGAINEKFRSALRNFFLEWKDSVEQCLRDGVEGGFFNEEIDPTEMAGLIVSQIEGAILLSKVDNSVDTFEATCGTMRKLIVKSP